MKKQSKIAVLGGDMRQLAVANGLCDAELEVYTSGLCSSIKQNVNIKNCDRWEDAIEGARAVVLPLPVSMDDVTLNCPALAGSDRIPLDSIIECADKGVLVLGGRIPGRMLDAAHRKGTTIYDYFLSESLQIKNAYLTAEAAVSIAMNSLNKRLGEAKFAITGSGRISRFLAHILRRLGASVTVAARNAETLAYFALDGCDTLLIQGDDENGERWYTPLQHGYDIIFNTVPAWLFDRKFLEGATRELLIIELASSPGGVDVCAARELSANVMWAPSLPGKYAPESAGRIICESVLEVLGGVL